MIRPLRILYVAYPLLPVSDASAGGAEQMLATLEREMHARGHDTTIAACRGSYAAGTVFETGEAAREYDRFEQRDAEHNARVVEHVRAEQIAGHVYDLVHDEGGSFWSRATEIEVGQQNSGTRRGRVEIPVLATLHLPRSFYREELFSSIPENVYFNCVSDSQAGSFCDIPRMIGVAQNGIDVKRFPLSTEKKDDYVLWLGRICEEKGPHLAIEAARRARLSLILVGQVYPFSYHQAYFERQVKPHLDPQTDLSGRKDYHGSAVRFIEHPDFSTKLELLQHARALLVPNLADETSSLVAMEAMACGTPVIAFRRGALPQIVAHGKTGWIVDSLEEMAAAVRSISIFPMACRHRVEKLYSSARMADEYERLYQKVIGLHAERQSYEELAAEER